MEPKEIANSAERLRDATIALFDRLDAAQLAAEALPPRDGGPAWSVEDVFRHLAATDREVLVGSHLLDFLPFREDEEFESSNDANVEALRGLSRPELRDRLVTWGRRLRLVIANTPGFVARMKVPTLFGSVSLAWTATLRVYDEWVHQDDICRAVDDPDPTMDLATSNLLAEFHMRALPPRPLRRVERDRGVVEVAFSDALATPAWRFDMARRQYGPRVEAEPTVAIETDVPTWCRVAADRVSWEDAEASGDLAVIGDDREAASALLDIVRVV